MVPVVGGIFADGSADEARRTISDIMLLDSSHLGIFLDIVRIVGVAGRLLDWFGRLQMTLFMDA